MDKEAPGLRWGVEQRLEFIEFRLLWEGGVNRSLNLDSHGKSFSFLILGLPLEETG